MDRDEAEEILERIRRDESPPWRSKHFLEQLEERHYTIKDAYHLIKRGKMEAEPEKNEEHGNYVVRLRGKALDGRPTRLAVGLRRVGPNNLISIVDLTPPKKRGKKK
ncbi:MAG TPA: hypothetical protein VGJ98_03245 [Candidatus Eisenbacteria bacterium]|jgi:hypothetical protein